MAEYHRKGGQRIIPTLGADDLIGLFQSEICAGTSFQILLGGGQIIAPPQAKSNF